MSDELEYYKNLARIMIKTKGSRFTAANSLMVKERWSLASTSLLSVFMTGWGVWLVATPEAFSPSIVRFFGGLSIIASMSILVLCLLDSAYQRSVRAEKLQQNALQISVTLRALERELCAPSPNFRHVRALAAEYEKDVADTQINHTPSDYKKWLIDSQMPVGRLDKIGHWLKSVCYDIWYYIVPLSIHIGLVLVLVISSIWFFQREWEKNLPRSKTIESSKAINR